MPRLGRPDWSRSQSGTSAPPSTGRCCCQQPGNWHQPTLVTDGIVLSCTHSSVVAEADLHLAFGTGFRQSRSGMKRSSQPAATHPNSNASFPLSGECVSVPTYDRWHDGVCPHGDEEDSEQDESGESGLRRCQADDQSSNSGEVRNQDKFGPLPRLVCLHRNQDRLRDLLVSGEQADGGRRTDSHIWLPRRRLEW